MNNDAFRALVRERAKIKTTKEIAREAVEQEFEKRKKRKHGGSSSEESDGSDTDQEDEPRRDLLTPVVAQKKARQQNESKYRDRAKERREGKNVDYQAQASLLEGVTAKGTEESNMDRVTISKYLGGDEAHTHLVKGLDVTLVRKVKRELGKETMDVDADSLPGKVEKKEEFVQDKVQARLLLQRVNCRSISSELGRQMLSHLKNVHLPLPPLSQLFIRTSPAGFAIQRSILTFSTLGDPRDRNRAWEVPLESTQAVSHADVSAAREETNGATPVDAGLLQQMKRVLAPKNQEEKTAACSAGETSVAKGKMQKHQGHSETINAEESDDDDIFDGIDDYVPPTQASASNRAVSVGHDGQGNKTQDSIFSGLIAPKKQQPLRAVVPMPNSANDLSQRTVISRDVLGSQVVPPKANSTHAGISVSSYQGGYGEEMDVDFDGRFAAEEEHDDGKKRRKEETTLAALEYGAGRRKRK
jgi:hypothetical protein